MVVDIEQSGSQPTESDILLPLFLCSLDKQPWAGDVFSSACFSFTGLIWGGWCDLGMKNGGVRVKRVNAIMT